MRRTADASLVRVLGVWGLAASIVNITVGGGIFRLPAGIASTLGPAAPLAYVVCAAAMGLIVLCFAEAGSRVSLTGGVYAYAEVALGPFFGFLCGVLLWAGVTAALAAVSSFLADALAALAPAISSPVARRTVTIVVLVALAFVNVRGVRVASGLNAVTTAAKLLPLLFLVVVGLHAVRAENLRWNTAPAVSDLARSSVLLIFAFLGIETALAPSGEVKDPARTVPRAILVAMLAVTVLYLAVQLVVQGILGPSLAGQQTPLAAAAASSMGAPGRELILVGSTVSMFGYIGGVLLAAPRMLFAFARDGFLPPPVAAVHPRFHTPHVAIVIQTLIVILLAVTGTFERLAIIANGSVLLAYLGCCAAVLELRRRNVQADGTPFRVPAVRVVPVLAMAVIVWLLASLERKEWAALGVVMLVAVAVYGATRASRLRAAQAALQQ